MKPTLALLVAGACLAAPTLANAGLHISVPHGKHHHHLQGLHHRREASEPAQVATQAQDQAPAPAPVQPAPQGW